MADHIIAIVETGEHFECNSEMNVIEAQRRAGMRTVSSQCRRGGCGLCKVRIVSGAYETLPMNRTHISADEGRQGIVFACRLHPRSALVISVATDVRRFVWPVLNE